MMAEKQATQQVPSVGRIVHFTLSNGEHRPAIIVATHDAHGPSCDLRVFLHKHDNVSIAEEQPTYAHQGTNAGTWHWPEPDAKAVE